MKKLALSIFILALTTTVFAAGDLPSPKQSTQTLDQIAAVANDGVITQNQVNTAYKNAVRQMTARGISMPDESTMKKEILEQLIYQELQVQLAKRNGITVTGAQVTQTIKNIAKQHNISLATLKQKIKEQGQDYSTYRKAIQKQILISMIQHRALSNEMKVSNAEVDQFLDTFKSQKKFAMQYHLIDVLVPLPPAPTTTQAKQAKTEALALLKSLKHGAKLDTIKGAEINDLGWRTKMNLPDIFIMHLTNLKPGGIFGPLRAANGYHILKLVGVKKAKRKLPSRETAKRILMEQKFQKALRKWVVKLRKQSYVNIVKPQ